MQEQICPKCGKPVSQHSGAVGAPMMVARSVAHTQLAGWQDTAPYAIPKTASPTWLQFVEWAFFKKAPEDLYRYLDGLPGSVQNEIPDAKAISYLIQKLDWWITHRWSSPSRWQAEFAWADDPGGIMWPMFQLWWYGWDSPSRGKHFVKCSGQKPEEFWDPVTLQCAWD